MADLKYLYTVTGLREPFYAVVDLETGQAWTSPTKDGAIRQAKDAGLDDFIERTITRPQFLRSVGIEDDPANHAVHKSVYHEPAPEPKQPSSGTWFVGGGDGSDVDALPENFSLPARLGKKGKKLKPGVSPFAGDPIAAPTGQSVSDPEDMLIIPSDHKTPDEPTPFTDEPPPAVNDIDE